MKQQYADKNVVFLAPTPTEVVIHGLSFLEISASSNTVEIITALDKSYQFKGNKTIFTTMALYLEMLSSKQILLHHCSLVVIDEIQQTLKGYEYNQFHHDHWCEEMVTFRPRVLGLLGNPTETLEIVPWIASLEKLSKNWDADICTSISKPELDLVQRISWVGERHFNSCADIPPSDVSISGTISEHIKFSVSVLISLHRALLEESTRFNSHNTSPFNTTSYPELQPYPTTSYYNKLMDNLSTLAILVKSGDQDFSLQSRISPFFSRLLTRLVSSAPTSIMKLLTKHIQASWEALESIYIFGASFSLPLLRSLADILQPDDEASHMPIYRTFIFQLNSEKENWSHCLKNLKPTSVPLGRANSLLDSIRSYPGTPKIWVTVQNEAIANTVAEFLSQQLSLASTVRSLSNNTSQTIDSYTSGTARILVAPMSMEMEQIQATIPSAHFIIHLDGPQTCRSLISNQLLAESVALSATNIFIGSPEEMEALGILAAEDEFTFACVRSFCDPQGVDRDEVDVEEEFKKYQTLVARRVSTPLPSISPSIITRRRPNPENTANSFAAKSQLGANSSSSPYGFPPKPTSFDSPILIPSPQLPSPHPQMGLYEGYTPTGQFGANAPYAQFYDPSQIYQPHGPTLPRLPQMHSGIGLVQPRYGGMMPPNFASGSSAAAPILIDAHAPTSTSSSSASGINYVGRLQEHFQKLGQPLPHYDEISGAHGTNHFVQECSVGGKRVQGEGQTKKAAKTDSAYKMLTLLKIIK